MGALARERSSFTFKSLHQGRTVKIHLGSAKLGSISLKTLGEYVQQRKAENIGNRTINMEVGVLRRVLKKFELWTRFAEDYRTIMSIAGRVNREMLTHYSHIRAEAKRKAVTALDNVTITSQLGNGKTNADEWKKLGLKQIKVLKMVGTGRFELPTPRTPSECSTRLSHVPTQSSRLG